MAGGMETQRFEGGHHVPGYRILFDISHDGDWLVTGSSDGRAAVYAWGSTQVRSGRPSAVAARPLTVR